ncbi:unnamed protein product [Closterium sp. NIES-53]
MWQIPVVPMPKDRQVAASISTKGEAVGSGDGANGRAKEIKSKKCNLGGTSKLGEHEESVAAAQKQHKGEENPKAAAEEEYGENMWGTIASAAFSNPTSATGECDWLTLHRRMGHVALPILQQLVKNEMVSGICVKGEPDEVLGCPTCMQAKFTRYPFSSSEAMAKAPLDEVVMDVVGPLKLGAAGAEYFLTIVDVYTRMTWVYVLSKKSDVAETVKTDWLPMVERQQDRGVSRAGGAGAAGAGGTGVAVGAGVTGGTASTGPGGARTQGTGAAGTGCVEGAGAGVLTESDTTGVGGPGAGVGGPGVGGAGAVDLGDTVRPRTYFVPLLQQSGGLTERRELVSRLVSPVRTAHRVPRLRPPPVSGTHAMTLCPSSVPLRVPLPAPPESSLPEVRDPESDHALTASPTLSRLLATAVTDPSFESPAAFALVAEQLDFSAACHLDYAFALVAECAAASPPSVGGECALGTDVLEDRQEDFECLAATVPRFASMLLAPEGDPDAPDIPTPRSYADAITGPYSSQWQAAMDAEMASLKSTGTYVDEVPPPGANIVDGMWIFRVKRPRVLRLPSKRRDYELHSLDFSTAFLQGSLHEKIWLRRPTGFTESFPVGTQWSLWRPVYSLRKAPREWHDTLRTTLAALGFSPATADPSLLLRTDTSLPSFYVLVYVDDLVFATADTEALTLVKSELQKRHTCTDLGELRSYLGLQITRDRARRTITLTQSHMVHQVLQRFGFQFSSAQPTPLSTSHSLLAPPSNESVEPSGPYPELVGCLMYLMTCTRPDLAYPLSLLARYVAHGRHRKVHWDAAKRVLRYLCSTLGMGLVLGGRGPVVLTGHADASWVDDSATQRSSQGYTFSLGSGSVSWQSTRSSSVLSSSCEAEIYAGAMAAQELRWLTYLLTDLGEQPRSPPFLYQRGQLRLAYVATRANTADVFTKALSPGDHQRFVTVLGLLALLLLTGLMTTCSPPLCLWGGKPQLGLVLVPHFCSMHSSSFVIFTQLTLGLPSPSTPSPPSPPDSGPPLPPPDPSTAIFPLPLPPLSPPLSHTWPSRRSPCARPSSPVPFTDLCTALFRSSPPRSFPSVLPSPPQLALTASLSTPVTYYYRTYRPILSHVLASLVTDPRASFLVAAPPTSPLAVEGDSSLGCDALEDRQFELELLAAASPHLYAMLLALEGDPDALDILTPRTYA